MKRILITTSTFPAGDHSSGSRCVYDLSRALQKYFQIYILAPHQNNLKKIEYFEKIKIYRYQYFFKKYQKLCYGGGILANLKENKWLYFQVPFFLFFQFIAVLKIIKREKIDLIHANWAFPQGFIAFIASFFINIPYIITVRGADIHSIYNSLYKKIVKLSLARSKVIIATNPNLAADLKKIYKVPPEKIKVIPSGIDTDFFQFREHAEKKIKERHQIKGKLLLSVGRLIPEKGIDVLLQALSATVGKFSDIKLLVAGSGPRLPELKRLCSDLKIGKSVIFLENIPQDDLINYYSACDIFILPSRKEGTPSALLEAMSVGKAVITSNFKGAGDAKGAEYIIKDNENGLIVPSDNPERLLDAILKLLDNDSLREKLGRNACLAAKRFDYLIFANRYKDIIKSII